jgi:hypothetical protein
MFKKLAFGTATILLSLLFCLLLLELTLRTGLFDNKDDPHPIWIPHKFQKIHDEIENENWQFAKLNQNKFTDDTRNIEKEEGIKRIAVLGDSFVWGTGTPYELTWNHKLENLVNEKHKGFEVLSWGFPAWSTMDELSFLENHGIKYDIDMLIVGYVNNDPHMQRIELKVFSWHNSTVAKGLKIFFPNTISFIRAYLYNFLFKYFDDYGYSNWVLNLHSKENLDEYANLLRDFSLFCHSKNIKLLFALTPSNHEDIYRKQFDKVIPLLKQAGIEYIDLYTPTKKEYGHINARYLWANPADSHPGPLLTDLFASHVLDYIETHGVFSTSESSDIQNILSMSHQPNDRSGISQSLINIALTHNSRDIRREAVNALVELNVPYAIEKLAAALLGNDHKIREAATYALGEINNTSSVDPLIKALNDKNSEVRKSAILALEKKNISQIINPLIIIATRDSDKYVRRIALLVLTKFKDTDTLDALIKSLNDDFFYNRKTAAIAIGKLHNPQAVEPLINALYDDFVEVRLAVVEALGEIKDPRSVNELKRLSLKDDNPLVRDYAAAAVKKITGKEFGKYRRKLLRMWQTL